VGPVVVGNNTGYSIGMDARSDCLERDTPVSDKYYKLKTTY